MSMPIWPLPKALWLQSPASSPTRRARSRAVAMRKANRKIRELSTTAATKAIVVPCTEQMTAMAMLPKK